MDFDGLRQEIVQSILRQLPPRDPVPMRISAWVRLVRLVDLDGVPVEETVGKVHKLYFTTGSFHELVEQIAENILLAVFGEEVALVHSLPNLIVRILDRKAVIPMSGAPPLTEPDQVFLKVTAFEYSPSLLERLFAPPPPPPER